MLWWGEGGGGGEILTRVNFVSPQRCAQLILRVYKSPEHVIFVFHGLNAGVASPYNVSLILLYIKSGIATKIRSSVAGGEGVGGVS